MTENAARGLSRDADVCAALALDVRNAFNSVPWHHVDDALRTKKFSAYTIRLLRAYMGDEGLVIGDSARLVVICSVLQSSIIGPVLKNIFYGGLLHKAALHGAQPVGARTAHENKPEVTTFWYESPGRWVLRHPTVEFPGITLL